MYKVVSQFEIGAYRFRGCNNCTIDKSIHSYRDTAEVLLPSTSVLRSEYIDLPSRQTAKQFVVGDFARIELGYDDILKPEFVGFVSRIDYTRPVAIQLEGYSWLLRNAVNIRKSWKSTTLKEVLNLIIDRANTDLKEGIAPMELHPAVPDVPLKNIQLNDVSGTQVIDYLKGVFKGIMTAFFLDNVLYVGLTYMDINRELVKYRLDWNTLPANSLKYHRADETKVKVNLQFRNDAGKQIVTTTGKDGGIVRRDTLTVLTDEAIVKQVAEAKLLQESFNGYEGSITTLGLPYCQPGYRAELIDYEYSERQGVFFVESTNVRYGMSGFRRKVELGLRLT